MKKHTYYNILWLCLALPWFASSCSNEIENEPNGWLEIAKPTVYFVTETRADVPENEIDYWVGIKKTGETEMPLFLYSSITGSIPLSVGSYTLSAENCSTDEAETQPDEYGQPRYAGSVPFKIAANEKTSVSLVCSMANAAFQVVTDSTFYYEEFKVVATVGDRELTFTEENKVGYFNVGADKTAVLRYEVEARDAAGRFGYGSGELMLKARNLSKLRLKANAKGGVDVSISYDDTFTPVIEDIIVQ